MGHRAARPRAPRRRARGRRAGRPRRGLSGPGVSLTAGPWFAGPAPTIGRAVTTPRREPETAFAPPGGPQLRLHRHPDPRDPSLRAWDAADAYLLEHLADPTGADPDGRVGDDPRRLGGRWLVANDAFGALATSLVAGGAVDPGSLSSWSDSSLAHEALRRNLRANGLDADAVAVVPSVEDPAGPVRVALVKVPRTLAHLRDQLLRLRPLLAPDALVVGAGMTRDVHTSTIEAFEEAVGPTRTTRARRKARLLLADLDADLDVPTTPYPTTFTARSPRGPVEVVDVEVVNHADVFGRERLDQGARVLLEHLPPPAGEADVVDLGCGNGILGTVAALADPARRVLFADESYGAVASALATHRRAVPHGEASGHLGHVLEHAPDHSADLVLCNPPFHAQGARVGHVAAAMFADAHRVLRPGGRLLVVGNRHLRHDLALRRHGHVEVLGGSPKFVVLSQRAR